MCAPPGRRLDCLRIVKNNTCFQPACENSLKNKGQKHNGTLSQEVRAALIAGAPVFNFTAISMKARAARLRALSFRNTSARSRCKTASANLRADSVLDLSSSATFDREMKLMP